MTHLPVVRCVVLTFAVALPIFAQSPSANRHFLDGGLSFDYPPEWVLTDRSTSQAQHLTLTRPRTSLLIMLVAYRDALISRNEVLTATDQITEPYIQSIMEKLDSPKSPSKRDSSCARIGDASVAGIQILGAINGQPSTAEVYAFPKGRRFINLIYIRPNAEDAEGSGGWDAIRETLRVEPLPATTSVQQDDLELFGGNAYRGGILNGKALSLPRPEYSSFARAAHAAGTVVVEITIDEHGKVISVHSISGHRLLYPAAEDAARRAKFSPTTLCGQPVKITGTIIYNFIPN